MDPITMAIASLGAARDMAKGYLALKDEISRQQFAIDMQSKILDAQSAALDAQVVHQDLLRKVERLEAELSSTLDRKAMIARMGRDAGFYFLPGDPDPYCPRCVETEQKPVHLSKTGMLIVARHEWRCAACKSTFRQEANRFKFQQDQGAGT